MPHPVRFAVIADPHANALALEAVLADIGRRDVAYVVSLGDNVNGPLDPVRTLALLRDGSEATEAGRRAWFHVRGNGDRMTADDGSHASASAKYARQRLDAAALHWLGRLPVVQSVDGWLACHGSPASDTEYLLEKVTERGVAPRPAQEVAELLGAIDCSLVLCGHTHIPRIVSLPDRRVVVNPGSVGLPAYSDDAPFPHRMETGSPHARYAIVSGVPWRWDVELVAVDYDWAAAAASARAAGWIEWAVNLESGRCP